MGAPPPGASSRTILKSEYGTASIVRGPPMTVSDEDSVTEIVKVSGKSPNWPVSNGTILLPVGSLSLIVVDEGKT